MGVVSVCEHSNNQKLSAHGNVSASYVSQVSCPSSCALRGNGCYAENGPIAYTTNRLNRTTKAKKKAEAAMRLLVAHEEAKGIAALSGYHKLRTHVVGDCATPETAAIVGAAMVKHERRRGKAAWTYTHAHADIPVKAWQGAKVLASCDSVKQIPAARARGYAIAVIVPPHQSEKMYVLEGETIIPCPAQFIRPDGSRKSTCEHCTLCQQPELLKAKRWNVGFQPDSNTAKRVLAIMKEVK
jgi:hypothetical protein